MKLRGPLDISGGRPTTTAELATAMRIVHRSGVLDDVNPVFDCGIGRPRTLPLRAFLVAAQLNALHRHHQGHLVEIARILNALTGEQRHHLDIDRWDPTDAYDRVERAFVDLARILDTSTEPGADGFANRIAAAAVPDEYRQSASVAVDGTDLESWGALHGDPETVELDGEAAEVDPVNDAGSSRHRKRPSRRARVFGTGPDGRNIYTKDRDARAGHRSATNSRPAGPYIGFELHLAVQARDVRWTNSIDRTTLGPEVPAVITSFSLLPAGSHRAEAVVPALLRDPTIKNVVWDPGYSLCRPETAVWPLAQAGIETTFQPVTHQRGIRPFSGDALLIDGSLFSTLLPEELRDLPMPPRGAPEEDKLAYEAAFNRRARWRYVRHAGPDSDGATRWRCPFCAGLLRSRAFPRTMRRARTAPLVPVDAERCCAGTVTVQAAELSRWQRILPGTTAWRISMGRRQIVESVNAALKGAFVDLARGFLRVMGLTKATILLGFTLAAYNLDRIRSYRAKHRITGEDEPDMDYPPETAHRSKRRVGTWSELLGQRRPEAPG